MEMQVQSDSRIFLPGCAARRRIAGPCALAGRRGAGTGLAAATGHVPSVRPSVRAATAAPAASPPRHGPSSKSQQPPGGGGCTPHPTPPRPGGEPGPPPRHRPRGPRRAPAPAAPGGARPRPAAGGGHREGQHRRQPPPPRRGKGLLRSAVSISLKGPVPPGPRVAICISIGGSRRSAGAPSPSAAPRDVNPCGRGVCPPSAGQS